MALLQRWTILDSGTITDFPANNNNSASFKFKTKIAGRTGMVLKGLSNFWRILEMPLSNCEINLILTWSNRCFIIDKPIVDQQHLL